MILKESYAVIKQRLKRQRSEVCSALVAHNQRASVYNLYIVK